MFAALLGGLTPGLASAADGNDATRANAFDDDWEQAWVDHCRMVFDAGVTKTDGFVLQVGDSITHANPYSQWPRQGEGKTAEDTAFFDWSPAEIWGAGNFDSDSTNGWYLAAADTSGQRGMTASSGIDTTEFLSGAGNGGSTMPNESDPAMARGVLENGAAFPGNLHIETVAAAFEHAQIAVVMLGTNDVGSLPADQFGDNLAAIVDALEARDIVVVLSNIPPVYDDKNGTEVAAYNAEIAELAETVGLPLIDFHGEILARQPDGAWNGTLLNNDDVHPTASAGEYNSSSNPYAPGGDADMHCTGEPGNNVGYLLRSWLTVQKLKEVRSYVVDGVDPPDPGGTGSSGDAGVDSTDGGLDDTGTTGGAPATSGPNGDDTTGGDDGPAGDTLPAGSSGGSGDSTGGDAGQDDDGGGCSCRTGTRGAGGLWLLLLGLAARRRRRR